MAATAPAPAGHSRVGVSVSVKIPGAGSTTNARLRHIYSMAANTQSIQATTYAAGTVRPASPITTSNANIAAGSANCGASDAQGDRTCTFTLQAPVGADDFVFTIYDSWNAGTSTVAGNPIGSGVALDQTITAGSSPSITVTLNSIPATINLVTEPSVIHSLIPLTLTLDVQALDADNDIIVSNAFYDLNGNPITLTLGASMSSSGITTPLNGALTFPSGTNTYAITAPAPNGVQLSYNGNANDAGSPVYFSATSSSPIATLNTTQLAVVYPTFTGPTGALADPNLSVTGAFHGGAVFTPAQSPLLFIYTTQTGNIDYYNVASPGITVTSGAPASGYFGGAALVGSEFFFLAQNGMYSEPANPPSSPSTPACAGPCPPANSSGLVYNAANGNFYYTSGTNLVQYGLGGIQTLNLNVVATGGVAVDQSGNIWVVQTGANASLLDVNFSNASIVTMPLFTNSQPFDVITAGNGEIVVSDKEYSDIWAFNGGSGSYFYLPNGGVPWYLAADPAQPNIVWFDYATPNGQIGVGRLDLNTSIVTTEPYSAGPSGGQPGALAVSNSAGIMMLYDGRDTLVQVQP